MRPQVSVIVCAYNAERTVARTLDSLLAQSLQSLEIIAVDDGSRDGTLALLRRYEQENPGRMHVYTKQNEGIAAARNFALTKVSGEYFGFLDADDTCESGMFEDLHDSAVRNGSEMAVSNFWWVSSKGKRLQQEGPYQPGREMMVHLFATLWNKLYRTDFIRSLDLRFPDGNRYEDACFLYCLSCRLTKISFVDHAYVNYMQETASITHTNNDQVKNMITVFRIILQYYRDAGLEQEYHEELEYIHIKFFLGNSFLRSARIDDRADRERTIRMGWDLLNQEFPDWHRNRYLRELGGMKNRYFRMVNDRNLMLFAWIFHCFGGSNL